MISTLEQVRKIIVEQLGAEPEEVQLSSTFIEDLGADSLDTVELLMAFEEEFNVEIPDSVAEKMRTVGDVVEYLDGEFENVSTALKVESTNASTKNDSENGGNNVSGSKFTILGETGSGKTCYLLGMYFEMSAGIAGYTVIAENEDDNRNLTQRYEMLNDKSRGASRFPAGTDEVQKMNFKLQYAYETISPFEWIDYPGGFLDPLKRDTTTDQYKEVEKSINESDVLFICIDGENLVGDKIERKINKIKRKCGKNISPYLGDLKDKLKKEDRHLPPIGMIVTKYDLCESYTNPSELKEIIKKVFEPLFEDDDTFVAIIPVSLGATLQDDSYQGELEPLNIHLPILLGINFALVDDLYYGRYLIENAKKQRDTLKWLKEDEEDSFFLWRSDDKIRRLANEISEIDDEIQHNRQVAKYFKKSLYRVNNELDTVNMIFANGSWLDRRGIHKYWDDLQSIVDYF